VLVSAWLARRGTRPVGLDNSAAQLTTARQFQDRFGLRFPIVLASVENAPFADAHLTWPSRSAVPHLVRSLRLDPRGGPGCWAQAVS
jgi:hypothetical protein